jgi:hypothetical protein
LTEIDRKAFSRRDTPASPVFKVARIIQQLLRILEHDDSETLETVSKLLAFRLELLRARDTIH